MGLPLIPKLGSSERLFIQSMATTAPAPPASEGFPEIPMSEGDDMAEVLETLKQKIAELEA